MCRGSKKVKKRCVIAKVKVTKFFFMYLFIPFSFSDRLVSSVLVYVLIGALVLTLILSALLVLSMDRIKKKSELPLTDNPRVIASTHFQNKIKITVKLSFFKVKRNLEKWFEVRIFHLMLENSTSNPLLRRILKMNWTNDTRRDTNTVLKCSLAMSELFLNSSQLTLPWAQRSDLFTDDKMIVFYWTMWKTFVFLTLTEWRGPPLCSLKLSRFQQAEKRHRQHQHRMCLLRRPTVEPAPFISENMKREASFSQKWILYLKFFVL